MTTTTTVATTIINKEGKKNHEEKTDLSQHLRCWERATGISLCTLYTLTYVLSRLFLVANDKRPKRQREPVSQHAKPVQTVNLVSVCIHLHIGVCVCV